MLYISVQIDDAQPKVFEICTDEFNPNTNPPTVDNGKVSLLFPGWIETKDCVMIRQYWGSDYCNLGMALEVRRHRSDADVTQVGKYTVAVFATREEAEAFDRDSINWEPNSSRPGMQIASQI